MQNSYPEFLTRFLVTSLEAKEYLADPSSYQLFDSILSLSFRALFIQRLLVEPNYSSLTFFKSYDGDKETLKQAEAILIPRLQLLVSKLSDEVKKEMIAKAKANVEELLASEEASSKVRTKYPYSLREELEYNEFILDMIFCPRSSSNRLKS